MGCGFELSAGPDGIMWEAGGAARRSLAAYGGSATNDYIYFRPDDDSFLVHSSATLLITVVAELWGKLSIGFTTHYKLFPRPSLFLLS